MVSCHICASTSQTEEETLDLSSVVTIFVDMHLYIPLSNYNSHNSAVPLLKRVARIVWNREINDNLFGACDNDNVLGLQLLCPGTLPLKACQSQPTTNKARRLDSDF